MPDTACSKPTDPFASSCKTLSCSVSQFSDLYNGACDTKPFIEEALAMIEYNRSHLEGASGKIRLYELLNAMLKHAPSFSGQRYAAVAIYIAGTKGPLIVVRLAQAWLASVILPMWSMSLKEHEFFSTSHTPTAEEPDTPKIMSSADRWDQEMLRAMVAHREEYRCALTHDVCRQRVIELAEAGLGEKIPHGSQRIMDVAYIIPKSLIHFESDPSSRSRGGFTWEMFCLWTGLDIASLTGSKINSPSNAIFMTADDHVSFRAFHFYLDKAIYPNDPNKYRVKMLPKGLLISNCTTEGDVIFPTQGASRVEPPDLEFLRVHAAFAKVLHLSCASGYFPYDVESSARDLRNLPEDGESDVMMLLTSRLASLSH